VKTKIIYKRKDEIFNEFHLHVIVIMNSKVAIRKKKSSTSNSQDTKKMRYSPCG
jgi:hypothetical protein